MRPTIGRIVWYRAFPDQAPLAAIVTKVWSDTLVNLAIFREDGTTQAETSVPHYTASQGGRQWEWPPRSE